MPNAYVALWSKERCSWLRRVRDNGPLCVLFGGHHLSLPSLNHLRDGDTTYVIWVSDGQLRVIAQMVVNRLIALDEYIREHLHLEPTPTLMAALVDRSFQKGHAELGHRAPTGCIEHVAIGTGGTLFNFERSVPEQQLSCLKFGSKPGAELALKGIKNGRLTTTVSLQAHPAR